MELARKQQRRAGACGLTVHVNKVDHVTTIDRVAAQLGESVDFLHDIANEMDIEDGVIWVYGVGDDGVLAFTDFGVEHLVELIKIHNETKPAYAGCLRCRRLVKDYERYAETLAGFHVVAFACLLLRRAADIMQCA